nr:DUF6049 family protein [Nocardioides luti]
MPALAAVVATAVPMLTAAPATAYPLAGTGEESTLAAELPAAAHAARVRHATHAARATRRALAASESPLQVTIDTLTPSYVPRKGPVRITGSVTNEDTETWRDVRTYSFMSATPMTSSAELAESAALPETAYVGDRITAPGTFATIDELAPGQTKQFAIKVPRALLPAQEPGVYWFGVHALGEGPDGRVDGADGRARTFVPLVPTTRKQVDTALVLPIRRDVTYAADGSLEDVEDWTTALSPDGKLRDLVDFGASAGSRPLTWLIDPSVPDAARRLVDGNPPVSFAATPPPEGEGEAGVGTDDATPTSPSPSDGASGDGSGDAAEPDPLTAAAGDAAAAWLDRLHEGLQSSQILALPYGDLDVAAAAERNPSLYDSARTRSGTDLTPWDLPMTAAIAPPSGYLDADALDLVDQDTTALVTDRMFPGQAPPVAKVDGRTLVSTSSGAMAGGPGPGDPLSPVALRQRIVSEAALRVLAPGTRPLVAVFPGRWSPTRTNGFFEGLDISWLHLTSVATASARDGRRADVDDLTYPRREARRELDAANFAATDSLIRTGETLQNVLTENSSVADEVADRAYSTASYAGRDHPDASRADADAARTWLESQMSTIRIEAPRQVTLSSASGRFAATLVNGLDEPVTVSIQAMSDQPLEIRVPETIPIGPGARTTVLLNASTQRPGVHNVTLVVTDVDGTPLGGSDQVPIRSAQVSGVIWVILGTGVALLFGAILVRLFRRVRAAARAARQA